MGKRVDRGIIRLGQAVGDIVSVGSRPAIRCLAQPVAHRVVGLSFAKAKGVGEVLTAGIIRPR